MNAPYFVPPGVPKEQDCLVIRSSPFLHVDYVFSPLEFQLLLALQMATYSVANVQ